MVEMSIRYAGGLHCTATHGPSQTQIATDAPTDNLGKGEAFSPTDLVATALATCMATTMAIVGERQGIDLTGMTVNVTKAMTDSPRRIGEVGAEIHLPLPENCIDREVLERAALNCPVQKSLHPDVQLPVKFFWNG